MFSRWQQSKVPPVQNTPSQQPQAAPRGPAGSSPSPLGQRGSSPGPNAGRPAPSRYGPDSGYADPNRRTNGPMGGRGARDPASGDAMRSELLRGAREPAPRSYGSESNGGYRDEQRRQDDFDDEDEEVEGIKKEIRAERLDTLKRTRNILAEGMRMEESGRQTLGSLREQGVRLGNIDHQLDMANLNVSRSEDATKEINALNRSIFIPNISFSQKAKRAAQEQKILERHQAEQKGRESLRKMETDTRALNEATFRGTDRNAPAKGPQPGGLHSRLCRFENTAEDDALEDEIGGNINQVLDLSTRFLNMSKDMQTEIRSQNARLDGLLDKTESTETRVFTQTRALGNIRK